MTDKRWTCGICCGLVLGLASAAPAEDAAQSNHIESSEEVWDQPLDLSVPLISPHGTTHVIDASKFLPKQTTSGWNGKAGIDNRPMLPDAAVRPERFIANGAGEQAEGVAWANVTAPNMVILDRASFETRLDPVQQSKLGMNLSRSVPVGNNVSVTWQQGYAVTHAPLANATIGSNVVASKQAVSFSFLPAETTLSLGAAISSTDEKWLRSMSAEQKLFGGPLSITGTISETATGTASKSLKAGFKKTW